MSSARPPPPNTLLPTTALSCSTLGLDPRPGILPHRHWGSTPILMGSNAHSPHTLPQHHCSSKGPGGQAGAGAARARRGITTGTGNLRPRRTGQQGLVGLAGSPTGVARMVWGQGLGAKLSAKS